MEKRERISPPAKFIILASALLVSVFSFLFGILALIPYAGLFGTIAGFVLSIVWTIVLSLWLLSISAGLKRLWVRVGLIFGLQTLDLMFSMFPFLGELISAATTSVNFLVLYFLIHAIEKEDREYNKLQERKEKELGRAQNEKRRRELEKQFEEEERRMAERSVLNKKNA